MARVGYARVSSSGQSLEVQLDKLKHCDKIYQEKKGLFGNCRENETGFNTHPNVFNDLAGQARGFCSRFHGNSQRAEKSGASGKRPRLKACLEYIREGDTLVVTRLDRLARSTLHLCQIAADLERKQVNLQVLDQNINTNSVCRYLSSAVSA